MSEYLFDIDDESDSVENILARLGATSLEGDDLDFPDPDVVDDIKGELLKETKKLKALLSILGIDGIDEVSFGEFRNRRYVNLSGVVDLYLDSFSRKQLQNGSDYFQSIPLGYMTDIGGRWTLPKIKEDQVSQTQEILKALRFRDESVTHWFQEGGEETSQELRLVGWLATQPFMKPLCNEVAAANKDEQISLPELYARFSEQLTWTYLQFVENRDRYYDMNISSDKESFKNKRKAMNGIVLLTRLIFFGEEFKTYLHG